MGGTYGIWVMQECFRVSLFHLWCTDIKVSSELYIEVVVLSFVAQLPLCLLLGFGKPNQFSHSSGDFGVHIGEGDMEPMSKEKAPPNAVLTSTAPGPMTGQFSTYENLPDASSGQ